jgi:hypothetical protein
MNGVGVDANVVLKNKITAYPGNEEMQKIISTI